MSASKRKMVSRFLLIAGILLQIFTHSNAQTNSREYKLIFYNLENLFDTKNDSLASDENFTPSGEMHWTANRLTTKINNISKVIIAAGGWQLPDILLFCETENRFVLEKLINDTPLKKGSYKIIHKESPDHRGIDVAMAYNSERFNPIQYEYHPLYFKGKILKTREILHVSGVINGRDTIHILGNHWPSRYSGLLETKDLRVAAAKLLKSITIGIIQKEKRPNIVIVGDFNENPDDETITETFGAEKPVETGIDTSFYNLSLDWLKTNKGTIKYQSQWFVFDQVMVSGTLLNAENGLFVNQESASIIDYPFLFEEDKKFGGRKPFRTYNGFEYQGGFSDHLPVMLRIIQN